MDGHNVPMHLSYTAFDTAAAIVERAGQTYDDRVYREMKVPPTPHEVELVKALLKIRDKGKESENSKIKLRGQMASAALKAAGNYCEKSFAKFPGY
jgi:hypothetical protein